MPEDPRTDWIATELRASAATERAPTHLRLQIDELSRTRSRRRGPRSRLVLVPTAALVAVVVLVLVLGVFANGPGGPTVAQAAVLGAQPIAYSPPGPDVSQAAGVRAYARFADVRFPSALAGGRWKFQTWRISRLDGRQILTIYYAHGSQQVAYLVAGTPVLKGQRSGFTAFRVVGRTVVSWQESDHSCLLVSAGASRSTLLGLARS